ncbi:MAG: Sec-independent protein translocase protein TatB [Halofilum sp. (in: g-proteobacteria)]|nr:Sec-independent protein translocase protein TatB [Halofilum sp. (in: g-proteobacteria)]
MFDLGFWELLVIGVVALLVVGPDRLPALATRTGRLVGRVRLKARRIQAQIQQELEAEHLKGLVDQRDQELGSLRREVEDVKKEFDHAARTARHGGLAGPSSHPKDMLEEQQDAGSADAPGEQRPAPEADDANNEERRAGNKES